MDKSGLLNKNQTISGPQMPKKSVSGPESVKTDHVGDTGNVVVMELHCWEKNGVTLLEEMAG